MKSPLRGVLVDALANKLASTYGAPSAMPEGFYRRRGTKGAESRDREYDANRWRRFLYLAAYSPWYFCRGLDRQSRHGSLGDGRSVEPFVLKAGQSVQVPNVSAKLRERYLQAQKEYLQRGGQHRPRPAVYRYPLWHEYRVPRAGGTPRTIHIPHPALRLAQLEIIDMLSVSAGGFSKLSYGMRAGTGGVVAHARQHADARFAAQFDLADCFPSITVPHLVRALSRIDHVSLGQLRTSIDIEAAVFLALLCTRRRCLVQGAPSSPILADLVLSHLDRLIVSRLGRYLPGAKYSRYFDDLCVSIANKDARDGDIEFARFKEQAAKRIRDAVDVMNLAINPRKTLFIDTKPPRTVSDARPQAAAPIMTITGIGIRGGRSVLPRAARRRLRAMEHGLRQSGIAFLWRSDIASDSTRQVRREMDSPRVDWKRTWEAVREHRSFLVRNVGEYVAELQPLLPDSRGGWRLKQDRVRTGRLEPAAVADELVPPREGLASPALHNAGNRLAPPSHWLSVRLALAEELSGSVVFHDFAGKTAWALLQKVARQLPTGRVTVRGAGSDGTIILAFTDSKDRSGTLGVRDPLGVVPKVLAVQSSNLVSLPRGIRTLQAFVAHCVFIASALGDLQAKPAELRAVLEELKRAWREAPLPSQQRDVQDSAVTSSRQQSGLAGFEMRHETEEERSHRIASDLHRKAANRSWDAILGCRSVDTTVFRRHRAGWATALLKDVDAEPWWLTLDALLDRNRASPQLAGQAPMEPAPKSLLRSCRLMRDRSTGARVAHYTLKSDADKWRGVDDVTTACSVNRQQEAIYEQAASLGEDDVPDQGHTCETCCPSRLIEQLRNTVNGLVEKDAIDPPADYYTSLEQKLGEVEAPATSRLLEVASLLQKLTLENIRWGVTPDNRSLEEHKNNCRNRFLRGVADKAQRRCFDLIRALRNLEAHAYHVAGFRKSNPNNPDVEILSLRSSCLELIGAFEIRTGPPGDGQHVLSDMMSTLEGREAALQLVRRVVECLASWRVPVSSDDVGS